MQIEAAIFRRGEDFARQDQAIGGDDRDVGSKRREGRLLLLRAEALWGVNRQPVLFSEEMNGRLLELHAATRGARRLRIDRDDVMPAVDKLLQQAGREDRRAHEDDAHPRHASTV